MKLSEMKSILSSGDIQLTKSLGQNFLHDQNQLRRIVDAAALSPTDQVLEIGPGLGPLTELLLAGAAEVLAIEKDRRLFDFLQKRFAGNPRLLLLCDDALEFVRRTRKEQERCLTRGGNACFSFAPWKVVSNLPYSVASTLLVELAETETPPQRIVVTLQLEVARRLMAGTDDDDYGILTLLMQLRYQPAEMFKIPRSCFFPEPDVDSACVVLNRREQPWLTGEQAKAFTKIVKRAFSQRRKMMMKLLRGDWPEENLQKTFEQLGLSPQIRAEKVSLEQFVEFTRLISA